MITLEQVKLLEEKVESLIGVVKSLYKERDSLKETIAQKEDRVEELEAVLHSFEISQAKIEESVMNALNQLDVFENSVASSTSASSEPSQGTVQPEEFAFSDSSAPTNNIEEHFSDSSTHQYNEVEKQKNELDDSDKQMDIF